MHPSLLNLKLALNSSMFYQPHPAEGGDDLLTNGHWLVRLNRLPGEREIAAALGIEDRQRQACWRDGEKADVSGMPAYEHMQHILADTENACTGSPALILNGGAKVRATTARHKADLHNVVLYAGKSSNWHRAWVVSHLTLTTPPDTEKAVTVEVAPHYYAAALELGATLHASDDRSPLLLRLLKGAFGCLMPQHPES